MSKRRFSLHIPEDLAEWLEREAARQSRTRNNLISRILQQYRKKPKTATE
ncbi:MAG TPA: ribbon-helix-helix protein, CopG family [Candidatus Bathyarchaeia archaeon]|nr:ribbon-helix-helix protein, CopG family [Candidatus Bathyarchaeia archaeon]